MDLNEAEKKFRALSVKETLIKYADDKSLKYISSYFVRTLKNYDAWSRILGTCVQHLKKADEIATLVLIHFLYLAEGQISSVANFLIYILILKGHHDIWSEFSRKFVHSFEEIVNLDLSVKLKFLEEHDFGFIAEICPKELRNAIAHQSFEIDSDGYLHIIKKGKKKRFTIEELKKKGEDCHSLLRLYSSLVQE